MQKNSIVFKIAGSLMTGVALILLLLPYLGLASKTTFGLIAIALATVGYFVTRGPSLTASIFLDVSGLIVITPSLYYFLTSLPQFTGSIIGVLFGAWVLALGVLKSRSTVTAGKRVAPLSAQAKLSRKQFLGMSKIAIVAIVVVIVAVGGFAAVFVPRLSSSSGSSCNSTTSSSNVVHISITSGAASSSGAPGYSPDNVTLVIGQNNTVVWQNDDSAHHTVTSNSAPSGASFNSGDISSGLCYSHTFTTAGTYEYYCTYHSWMKGTIVVTAAQ